MAEYCFFWRSESPFSQWHPSEFEVNGVSYVTAEQYMMHHKALLFGDDEVAAKILATDSPKAQKALGRKVRNFDNATWVSNRERIVYEGSRAKFTQSAALRKALLATGDAELVEASPLDKIWGIGLAAEDPRARDPTQWQGLNLLGKVLTRLKLELQEEAREREAAGRAKKAAKR